MTYVLIDVQHPETRAVVDYPGDVAAVQQWAAEQFGKNMAAYRCPVATDKILILCSTIGKSKDADEDEETAAIASDGGDITPADHEEDMSAFVPSDEGQIL